MAENAKKVLDVLDEYHARKQAGVMSEAGWCKATGLSPEQLKKALDALKQSGTAEVIENNAGIVVVRSAQPIA